MLKCTGEIGNRLDCNAVTINLQKPLIVVKIGLIKINENYSHEAFLSLFFCIFPDPIITSAFALTRFTILLRSYVRLDLFLLLYVRCVIFLSTHVRTSLVPSFDKVSSDASAVFFFFLCFFFFLRIIFFVTLMRN